MTPERKAELRFAAQRYGQLAAGPGEEILDALDAAEAEAAQEALSWRDHIVGLLRRDRSRRHVSRVSSTFEVTNMCAYTDDPDFDVLAESIRLMTPSARRPCLREMRDEGLISEEQELLLLQLSDQQKEPSN